VRRNLPRSLKCVWTVLGTRLEVSLGHPGGQVVYEILEGVRTAWPSVQTINCNRLSKIALKASISRPRSDGVALAFGRLHFCCTTCLTKDSVRTGTPHRPNSLQLSSHICVWDRNPITCRNLNGVRTVLPHHPDGCTWTLDSSRTLNSVRTICHYVRTDAILNSSKFLDTDGRPDEKFSSSGRMLLTDECLDGNITLSGRLLGIRLLLVGICTKSSLNTEISFIKLVTLATCHNMALYMASLWKQQHYIIVILSTECSQLKY
jgi:hypothetical protein